MTKYDKIIKVIFMKKVELLAPAGNLECLKVAVDNGADAIYLGGQSFSARAYADNFNEDEIIEGIRYAHIRGCKVYVTINTMVYDDEIDSLLEYVDFLYLNEVDALIVADFGLINLFKQRYPMLPIHVSTQMNTHSLWQIKLFCWNIASHLVCAFCNVGSRRLVLLQDELGQSEPAVEERCVGVAGAVAKCHSNDLTVTGNRSTTETTRQAHVQGVDCRLWEC
jgi:hypothetical protein